MLDVDALAEMLAPIIAEEVGKAVAPLNARIAELEARPAPEKGEPGEAGKSVERETVSEMICAEISRIMREVPEPQNGKDGRGIRDLLIDREGNLVATMDDGELKNLGPICGKDGEPGKDGRDGFSLDDFDVERGTDGRTFTLKFEQGDTRHEYELTFPVPVYCGVYKEGDSYVPGDMVTWGGSLWHCDAQTKDKPGTDGWTLAVKKGRDGKNANG